MNLLCGPAAIDGEIRAVDLGGSGRAEETGEGSDFLGGDEFLGRLGGEEDICFHLFLGHAAGLGGIGNLAFDQGGEDIARADGVAAHAVDGAFQGRGLGEAGEAVLGSDIGGLEGGGDLGMGLAHIDDAAPFFRLHMGQGKAGGVEGR